MTRSLRRAALLAALVALPLLGCGQEQKAASLPPPQEPTADSVAQFCNMAVLDHTGPKGQIFLKGRTEPLWFASVRDAFAFTMLPEEPKDLAAIYVNDMTTSADGRRFPPGSWIEARAAWFVSGSDYHAGMGETEIVPFSDRAAATRFIAEHGGTLARFAQVAEADVLGGGPAEAEVHAVTAQSPQVSENTRDH